MTWTEPSALERQAILRQARTIAIVGASDNPSRASYFVSTYLQAETSYDLWFVNPRLTELLGQKVYPSLADLPGEPDVVDVFRKASDLPQVADEAIAADAKVLWLQLGLFDQDVADRATDAGLQVVMNRCLKVEHARFHGGLHLAGFDTGVIDSRRRR
ncbi:CoA-binding protein [Barrientosiimonas endolithica]|uniref:CoA-binding protein n=1 Tax=Barrientosiimonas endolithica TaxID=1535208 RepID=A0ABM8H7J4_9MICO|nr:CoA-binding protein [Barrientosiimonas endolithica]BDZ56835.1 CoA-binding protein [Barrientosiimonas endolithica]